MPSSHSHRLPQDAVIHRMVTAVPTAKLGQTVGEVRVAVEKGMHSWETIHYIYVLDDDGRLQGLCSVRELYGADTEQKIEKILRTNNLCSALPEAHSERVAYMALRCNVKAVPILNESGVFLGVVSADSIFHILHHRSHRHLMRRTGMHPAHPEFASILTLPVYRSVLYRLPWLMIGLVGGALTAWLVGSFEEVLEKHLLLAAFIPLMVYMSDAIRTQMESFIIRDAAMDEHLPFLRYMWRQGCVTVVMAAICSLALGLGAWLWHGVFGVTVVLAASLFLAVCSSVCTGILVPYAFLRSSWDPANASGPVGTIIQDFLSIFIYFTVASLLL